MERDGGYCEFGGQGLLSPDFQLIPSRRLGKELIQCRHRRAQDFYLETGGEHLLAKCLQFIQELSASSLDLRVPVFALDWGPNCEVTRTICTTSIKDSERAETLGVGRHQQLALSSAVHEAVLPLKALNLFGVVRKHICALSSRKVSFGVRLRRSDPDGY